MQNLIDQNEAKKQQQAEEAIERNPLLGAFTHQGSPGIPALGRKNPAEKFANALRQSLGSNGAAN